MSTVITSPQGKERLVKEFSQFTRVTTKIEKDTRLIIPTVDEELPFFAENKEWFATKGIVAMVGSSDTIQQCRDKAEFNLFCMRHGFQTPRTWHMNSCIKPRFGKASKGVKFIDTSYIIQERCDFPEVSIDYFADRFGVCYSIIPRYRLKVINGAATDFKLVEPFAFEGVRRLGRELNLIGHNVIQGYWTGDTFIFGEVNTRFGGGSYLTWPMFNSPRWLVKHYDSLSKM